MSNKRMLYEITGDSKESMLTHGFKILGVFKDRTQWESQDWLLNCPEYVPVKATESEDGFLVWCREVGGETVQYYARIKKTSEYAHQDPGKPFPIRLTNNSGYARDGYIWEGGPGGYYRSKDINLFVRWKDELIKVL